MAFRPQASLASKVVLLASLAVVVVSTVSTPHFWPVLIAYQHLVDFLVRPLAASLPLASPAVSSLLASLGLRVASLRRASTHLRDDR